MSAPSRLHLCQQLPPIPVAMQGKGLWLRADASRCPTAVLELASSLMLMLDIPLSTPQALAWRRAVVRV